MKRIFPTICLLFFWVSTQAQSYEVVNYNRNDTPTNGVNIRTNLPFGDGTQMVSLKIEGYSYGLSEVISLNIVWYIYSGVFYNPAISSSGGYTPEVFLTNNNGFVNVFINDRVYYQRFKVTAFAQGMAEQSSWFQGWTVADEPIQGTQIHNLAYKNRFQGIVTNQGDLYSLGKVGIGTTDTKGYKLAVAGNVIAESVKVQLQGSWSDFVFADDYKLPTLQQTEQHIKEKGHLPGIPSAAEVKANGIDLGEMNAKLLQKIEELTLHLIRNKKEVDLFKNTIDELKKENQTLRSSLEKIILKLK
ncbi:hypothetical protein [Pedobacter heparinus]|uniref:hypothetical protein n=1 Tax=Pedobacter heparinus TaxID=984 RepID=UPI00293064E5|nr:hypothetical protein [Pedobacter heparinus]